MLSEASEPVKQLDGSGGWMAAEAYEQTLPFSSS